MSHLKDITNQRFGRLTAIRHIGHNKAGNALWLCRCDCGREVIIRGITLRFGSSCSCGCFSRDRTRQAHFIHGQSHRSRTPTYTSWIAMLQRCRYPKHKDYKNYGGRGIAVCEQWHSFENFLIDMGERPAGHTLDRIDPNGDYEPGNCRWATPKQQSANQCRSKAA